MIIGALILKEMNQDTDEELLESVLFDDRYQYALHLTGCNEIPMSDRTLSRFRARLYEYEMLNDVDLIKDEIERLAARFCEILKIDRKLKRMDSAMVASSCKDMGRLELIYTCTSNLVKALTKSGEADMLPAHLKEYTKENRNSVCYRLDKDEVTSKLEQVTADALELYEIAASALGGETEFQLLERMLSDQTENGRLKPNKQISPQSLQNPSDEDATFRRKSGEGHHGYVVNLVEDCGENGNIITHYDYDFNTHSDADFCAEVIESLGIQEPGTKMVTDGAFASEANFALAAENNIELVPTALTGEKPPEIIAGFDIGKPGEADSDAAPTILKCPAGHAPIDCKYNETQDNYRAHFDKATCENCPHKADCPVEIQKKTALVRVSRKTVNRAQYSEKLSTDEYKELSRKRNGVEGLPSVLRRRYRVDEMPTRGLVRTKHRIGLKIGAINVKRVIAALSVSPFAACFQDLRGLSQFGILQMVVFAKTTCQATA